MKKTYIYPKLNVIDLKDEICGGLLIGSDPSNPNITYTREGTNGNVGEEGGDVKALGSFNWDNEW